MGEKTSQDQKQQKPTRKQPANQNKTNTQQPNTQNDTKARTPVSIRKGETAREGEAYLT